MDVLRNLPEVHVLAPQSLRTKVKESIEKALARI